MALIEATETSPQAAVDFITQIFGPATSDLVFLCSLPNDRSSSGEPGEKRLMTRDPTKVAAFIRRWDRPGRALYFCVGTLGPDARSRHQGGSPRNKENISETIVLQVDIDQKDIASSLEEVIKAARTLPCRPSVIVSSGNGLHCYWLLREPADDPERAEAALKQLADLLGGDHQVAEIARLMRVPGTHNTKEGSWKRVEIIEADYSRAYELNDLEDMLSLLSPVVPRREKIALINGETQNPFLAIASRLGFKPPIDVEQRLAQMTLKGLDGSSIHETQRSVSASLLLRGTGVEEIVSILMEATRVAAGDYGTRWNWLREEREIRRMCETWIRKNPAQQRQEGQSAGRKEAVGGTVINLDGARSKRKTATTPMSALPVAVSDGVIAIIRQEKGDILLAEGDIWTYREGVWAALSPTDEQWLRTLIQKGCEAVGKAGDSKLANGAWKRLTEHPELYRRDVKWDADDVIATNNGMVDLRTRDFFPHDPCRFARRKVGVSFDAGAQCPKFMTFLASCFFDRSEEDRNALIGLLQECFGSMIAVRVLAREQRKALFLVGPSRTGKTQLSTIARRLIGDPIASPSVMDMTKEFGLQALYVARAWIRDDAINETDVLDPARFKTIVTGEPVDVNRKGRSYVTTSFEIPVILTTNAMPRARDSSDAIYNRCIVIEMNNVVDEAEADEKRRKLGFAETSVLADAIAEEEGPGILNWALAGLKKLRSRGRYDLPDCVRSSIQRFKDSNNPIGEWCHIALERSPYSKVARSDVLCSYHGWQKEEQGDEARALGGRPLYRGIRLFARYVNTEIKIEGIRYIGGVRLTAEALALWASHKEKTLKGGSEGYSLTKEDVNRPWEKTPKEGPDDIRF